MYTREWLKTVEEFFREKNRTWLTGDESTLLHYVAGTPAHCHSYQDVRMFREARRQRGDRMRKAKTKLTITKASWQADREYAVVEAVEQVRFFYEQGDQMEHETRQIRHRLVLMPFGPHWRILQDETDRESAVQWREGELEGVEDDFEEEERVTRGRYDRVQAFKFAELYWDRFHPGFQVMKGNDCTNFVSQCLFAGGMPMVTTGSRSTGWWYVWRGKRHNWSYSWAVAHSFKLALTRYLHAREVGDPRQLKVGDILCYDWNGDGRWQHNTIVVDFDAQGMPLVNAHTIASHRRYWDYRDSYAFTPRTKYAFFHIPDQF
jgi:hypothetical protein